MAFMKALGRVAAGAVKGMSGGTGALGGAVGASMGGSARGKPMGRGGGLTQSKGMGSKRTMTRSIGGRRY